MPSREALADSSPMFSSFTTLSLSVKVITSPSATILTSALRAAPAVTAAPTAANVCVGLEIPHGLDDIGQPKVQRLA